jgi:hypothetical protein
MAFPISVFTSFVSNAPLANAVGVSDMLALIQGGKTTRIPVTSLPNTMVTSLVLAPTTILTSGASYSVVDGDYFIGVDKSPGSATTINLPGSPAVGRTLIFKDMNGDALNNPITITGGTIDGASSYVIDFTYGAVGIQCTSGTDWSVLYVYDPLEMIGTKVVTSGATYVVTATDGFVGINKSVASATAVTLPASPQVGRILQIADLAGNAHTYNITVSGNGHNIDNAGTFVLNSDWQTISLIFTGTIWKVF